MGPNTDVVIQESMTQDDFEGLEHDAKLDVIYAELMSLKAYVSDLEKKAEAMSSPEAMSKMMQGFMGSFGL